MILSAQSIRKLCRGVARPMIHPFEERYVVEGRSAGLDCAAYCLTLKNTIWLWPFWMRIQPVVQLFDLPKNIKMVVADKSTNIRLGFCVFNTRGEPNWNGELMVELFRVKPWPIRIKAGTPIAAAEFLWLDEETDQPYEGKYQGQRGHVGPRFEKDTVR